MCKVKPLAECLIYLLTGGCLYYLIEILYRGHSHYSMFLCGGMIFYLINRFNQYFHHSLHMVTRMVVSTFIITIMELLFGILFNLILKEQVWDYSTHYYHYKGQICLTFSILWFFLSWPVLLFDTMMQKHMNKFIFHA